MRLIRSLLVGLILLTAAPVWAIDATIEAGEYRHLTASAVVRNGPGAVIGIFVASASGSPTIKVWDNTSAATTVLVNTFTPVAATFYRLPAYFKTGLYVEIGGTVDCTVLVAPGGAGR